jgi:hypothetical protein
MSEEERETGGEVETSPLAGEGIQRVPGEAKAFVLQPFGGPTAALDLRLEGQLSLEDPPSRERDRLRVTWWLSGDLSSVVLPAPSGTPPARADELWRHTCFEVFLAAEGDAPYWEVNLAPDGAWNLYRLAAYRQGLTPVLDREALPFTVTRLEGRLEVRLDLLLPLELSLACRQRPLRVGVTAVIAHRGGVVSYWALAHGGAEADFHRREDFLLRWLP